MRPMTDIGELQPWVAQAVRAESAARGMSIRQLALKAGIADKVLRRALDCERPFHLGQLDKVTAALDLPLSFLFTEAERRRHVASPAERAAAVIQSDTTVTRAQKAALLKDDGHPDEGVRSTE